MINEYRIVYGYSLTDVQDEVATLIHENWVPQGGVSITCRMNAVTGQGTEARADYITIIAQAMVRTKRSAE